MIEENIEQIGNLKIQGLTKEQLELLNNDETIEVQGIKIRSFSNNQISLSKYVETLYVNHEDHKVFDINVLIFAWKLQALHIIGKNKKYSECAELYAKYENRINCSDDADGNQIYSIEPSIDEMQNFFDGKYFKQHYEYILGFDLNNTENRKITAKKQNNFLEFTYNGYTIRIDCNSIIISQNNQNLSIQIYEYKLRFNKTYLSPDNHPPQKTITNFMQIFENGLLRWLSENNIKYTSYESTLQSIEEITKNFTHFHEILFDDLSYDDGKLTMKKFNKSIENVSQLKLEFNTYQTYSLQLKKDNISHNISPN